MYLGKRDFIDHISGVEPIGKYQLFSNEHKSLTAEDIIFLAYSYHLLLLLHLVSTNFKDDLG